MPTTWISSIVLGLFIVLAMMATMHDDPLLPLVVYASAGATAWRTANGLPVPRWAVIALIVFPAELALMTSLSEPPEYRVATQSAVDLLARRAVVESGGMLLVAAWCAFLLVWRPYDPAEAVAEGSPPA